MPKKWQKWPTLYKKSVFYTTSKAHFLKEMHQKNFCLRRKKVKFFFAPATRILAMCGDPGGGAKNFSSTQPHSHTSLYRSLGPPAWGLRPSVVDQTRPPPGVRGADVI